MLTGKFILKSLNEEEGVAVIESTTPYDKDIERGIILGGLKLVTDFPYLSVDNSKNPQIFEIEFH